jgi:aldose 1-epimerase
MGEAIVTVTVRDFGTHQGRRVDQFTLEGDSGVAVDIIGYGVAVRDWRVPAGGGLRHVVQGFEALEDYVRYTLHFGALAGRVANRIANAGFELDGVRYTLPANWKTHTLHGGPEGLGRLAWTGEADSAGNAVRFTLHSPDGAMGFPGSVEFVATYTLRGNTLRLELGAAADRRTPISVVQHQYFNLGSSGTVLDHRYRFTADRYTPVDGADLIPTGDILPVAGTQWDFRAGRTMRDAAGNPVEYDGNLVLPDGRDTAEPVAVVTGEDGELTLKLWTDRPGLQVYNSVWTQDGIPGLGGRRYGRHSAFCLEDQDFPDAVHHANFPSIIYGPDRPYSHWCEIEIAAAG